MIREPKGASLKTSKKNHLSSAGKRKKVPQKALKLATGSLHSLPPPAPIYLDQLHFDCGVAILSRQFDRDRDRVVARAHAEGHCFGLLTWFSDVEKQSLLSDFCKTNSGFCYYATGIHPDNIDRTNKKLHDEWMEKIEELGRKAECLAILSGLNLNREIGTHFSQESLFIGSMKLARKLHLPLILHVVDLNSLEKAVELLLAEEEAEDHSTLSLIIYDVIACTGAEESLRRLLLEELATDKRYAVSYVITGVGITAEGEEESLRSKAFVAALPVESLLVATDAPWKTPQNLPDTYLRTLRNESANIESIVEAMAATKTMEVTEMAKVLKENSLRVFGLESLSTLPFNVHNKEGEESREVVEYEEDEKQGSVMKSKFPARNRKKTESMEKEMKGMTLHGKDDELASGRHNKKGKNNIEKEDMVLLDDFELKDEEEEDKPRVKRKSKQKVDR